MHWHVALLVTAFAVLPSAARAQSTCSFLDENNVRHLQNDCQTDRSIVIPDGVTLNGGLHLILAVDTPEHPFEGGVVVARGGSASIVNTQISTALSASMCLDGDAALRGIYFDGASGEIADNTVSVVSRAGVECPEGNGIEVRNREGQGPAATVMVRHNVIDKYQKTGIVVHGNVDATIETNTVGTSTARQLVPNGIQVGPQATARVQKNQIVGRFAGHADGGSAILLFQSGSGTIVDENTIQGDSDVGIHVVADGATITNNIVFDPNPSGIPNWGIVNRGNGNVILNNTVTGFRNRYYDVEPGPPASRDLRVE